MDLTTLTGEICRALDREHIDRGQLHHHLQGVLREVIPDAAPGQGGRWNISLQQAQVIVDCARLLRIYEDGRR